MFIHFRCLVLPLLISHVISSQVCGDTANAAGQESTVVNQTEPSDEGTETQAQVERLTKLLNGSRWTGQFTTFESNGQERAAVNETYEITKAEKLADENLWMLTARIKYGERDVTVPLPITILWAGDTPVITVDQLMVPGLGTFDARVLIRSNKYSGTWTHNDHGGHLFGKIGRMKAEND